MPALTERLYKTDPYCKEFKAKIVDIRNLPEGQGIVLNKTAFYPEGGGQPSDRGVLNGVPIVSVLEDREIIIHVLNGNIKIGDTVEGALDWERRFDHMQQHTGQHLLSQTFIQLLDAETVSFHLGSDDVSIDIGIEKLNEEDSIKIEKRVNQCIYENRNVKVYEKKANELDAIPLRKRPMVEGPVRIVEIEQFDWSFCCGTHVRQTGEIGLIKIMGSERYKSGIRVHFLCGWRALRDFQKKNFLIKSLSQILTAGENDIYSIINKWKDERKSADKKIQNLLEQNLETEAQRFLSGARMIGTVKLVMECLRGRNPQEVQLLARKLVQNPNVVAVVAAIQERVTVFFACSDKVSVDMRMLEEVVAIEMKGAGGGGRNWAQCSTAEVEKIDAGMKKAEEFLATQIN